MEKVYATSQIRYVKVSDSIVHRQIVSEQDIATYIGNIDTQIILGEIRRSY